jgi:hypothetical protein
MRFGHVARGLIVLVFLAPVGGWAQQAAPPLTAEQDHQRMMGLLQITALRPGVSGDPRAANTANYDEKRANPYPDLPDPLRMKDGSPVTTKEQWWGPRRNEIMDAFDGQIYGRVPPVIAKIDWQVTATTKEKAGKIAVVTRHLVGHIGNSLDPAIPVDIRMDLTLPANAKGPVPVMMELGYIGTPLGKLPPPAKGPSWQEQVAAKGWGYAVLAADSIQPDSAEGLTHGIIGLFAKGQPRKPDDWGVLRAWAWGASRAMDYFETDPAVDSGQIGIWGHSRFGKAALVAMAYDARYAIAYISSSGAGGAKLLRRNYGETVENLASTGEYYWMAGNFLKYAGPLTAKDLPADAHELIALCAQRPVFIGAGNDKDDGWADPRGMFMAAVAAGPVYEFVGKKDLGTATMPPAGTALIKGDIAFSQHKQGHTPAPNWPLFLKFAQRYIHIHHAKPAGH